MVSYVPITDGSYEGDKQSKNDKENEVEKRRGMLPEKLKGLKRIGHSKGFDLENEATIRMCFRAPERDSGITSGIISYLTYSEKEYDYESSTAVDLYSYSIPIDCSNLDDGVPIVINGSNGFGSLGGQNCGKQIMWTYCAGTGTALYYNSCSDYSVWNDITKLPMEIEMGSGSSYNPMQVYDSYYNGVWHLNENSPSQINTSDSTSSNDGNAIGATLNKTGKIDGSGQFDGVDDYVAVPDSASLDIINAITIEVWVKPSSFITNPDQSTIATKDYAYYLQVNGNGYLQVYHYGTTPAGYHASNNPISLNTWQHAAYTYDGSNVRIYINGVLDRTIAVTGAIDNSAYYLGIGANLDTAGGFYAPNPRRFNGAIDEVRISGISRSAAYINQVYQNAIGTPGYGNLKAEAIVDPQGGKEAVIGSDSSGNILLTPAGSGKVRLSGALTDGNNDITVADAKAANDHLSLDLIKGIFDWQQQCSGCVGANDINTDEVQRRIAGFCAAGSSIRTIGADGTVTCEVDDTGSGGGTASDLACTSCVSNSEISELDWSKLQNYPAACPSGQYITTLGDSIGCSTPSGVSCSSCDSNFVNAGGDVMSGDLVIDKNIPKISLKTTSLTTGGVVYSNEDLYLHAGDSTVFPYSAWDADGDNGVSDFECLDLYGKGLLNDADFLDCIDYTVTNTPRDESVVVNAIELVPAYSGKINLGNTNLKWKEGHFDTVYNRVNTIGDVREYYKENPSYKYEIGTVIAIDTDSGYEIKPLTDVTDRILGVVAELAYNVTEKQCDEIGCYNINNHVDTNVAIYGKFSPVKIKGTIQVGDYLVASDEPGVVTSMYEKDHPFNPSAFKKSKNKKEYNFNAKMFPTLGIAMENYNSTQVGTIKVVLGK